MVGVVSNGEKRIKLLLSTLASDLRFRSLVLQNVLNKYFYWLLVLNFARLTKIVYRIAHYLDHTLFTRDVLIRCTSQVNILS